MKKEIKQYYYTFDDISHPSNITNMSKKTKTELCEIIENRVKPIITVCLLVVSFGDEITNISRGLSILSKDDKYDAREGRKLAKQNAIRASKGRKNEEIRRKSAVLRLLKTDCPFVMKGYANCIDTLTPREMGIVYSNKKVFDIFKNSCSVPHINNGWTYSSTAFELSPYYHPQCRCNDNLLKYNKEIPQRLGKSHQEAFFTTLKKIKKGAV